MLNHAWRRLPWAGWWLCAGVLSLVVLTGGCNKSNSQKEGTPTPKYEVADDTPSDVKTIRPDTPPSSVPDWYRGHGGQPAADSKCRPPIAGRPTANLLQQPPSIPGDQLDTVTVPQGTPEELMKFLRSTWG